MAFQDYYARQSGGQNQAPPQAGSQPAFQDYYARQGGGNNPYQLPADSTPPPATNPQPYGNNSLLNGLNTAGNFAHSAMNTLGNGLVNDIAGVAKFVTPTSWNPSISRVQHTLTNEPSQYQSGDTSQAGQWGSNLGGAMKFATEAVPNVLVGPEALGLKGLAATGAGIATSGVLGGLMGGGQSANDGSDKIQQIKDAGKSGLTAAALSTLFAGLNVAKNSLSKDTDLGQLFNNPTTDKYRGLWGGNATNADTSFGQAIGAAPHGLDTEPIQQAAEGVLRSDPTSTKYLNGFRVNGSGTNDAFRVSPSDLDTMKTVINYAKGNTTLPSSVLDPSIDQATQIASQYGIPAVKAVPNNVSDQITNGIFNANRINRTANPLLQDTLQGAQGKLKTLADAFQPIVDNGGHLPLDFNQSVFKNNPTAQKTLQTIWGDIGNTSENDNSVQGMNALKGRISDAITAEQPGTQLYAALNGLKGSVNNSLQQVSPAYGDTMKNLQGFIAGKNYSAPVNTDLGNIKSIPQALLGLVGSSPRILGTGTALAGDISRPFTTAAGTPGGTAQISTALLKLLGGIK